VQEDHYLLLCQRYIELNPVRADMVNDPAHYRWSSYRANGLGQSDLLITPHSVYSSQGTDATVRLEAYRALFRHELDDEVIAGIRLALNQGQPFGNGRFLYTIERMTGQRREAKPRGRPRKIDPTPNVLDGQLGLLV